MCGSGKGGLVAVDKDKDRGRRREGEMGQTRAARENQLNWWTGVVALGRNALPKWVWLCLGASYAFTRRVYY